MNRGVAATSAPFVLGLNADTVVVPGAIGDAGGGARRRPGPGRRAAADPAAGGRAPSGIPTAARLYSAGHGAHRRRPRLRDRRGGGAVRAWLRGREIFGVCGAACLLRRELFTELGGYDESYVSFYEDVDLNVRARIAGWRFAYVPEAVVWHAGNASWQVGFDRPGAENARLVARNRIATWAKFMPLASLPRILAVEVASLFRAARQGRLGATLRGKLEGLSRLPRQPPRAPPPRRERRPRRPAPGSVASESQARRRRRRAIASLVRDVEERGAGDVATLEAGSGAEAAHPSPDPGGGAVSQSWPAPTTPSLASARSARRGSRITP